MDAGTGAAGDLERLALAFAELVVATVGEFDVHELLQVLADRCVDVLDVAAAGLMLADDAAGLRVMVASNDQAKLLELFQIQHDEGPCLDSFRSGEAIVAQALDGGFDQWPRFAPPRRCRRLHQCRRGADAGGWDGEGGAEPLRDP